MTPRHAARGIRRPSKALYEIVARNFRVLGEPARLDLLHRLSDGERSAASLLAETGIAQAGLSKHMSVLCAAGFVRRWKVGATVRYALGDDRILALCELMCDRIEAHVAETSELMAAN